MRKLLVSRLYHQKITQAEIADQLAEMGCLNENKGKPWTAAIISKDIAELEANFREKNIEELIKIKMRLVQDLVEIHRLAIEREDYRSALQAVKQQAELLGLNAPLKSQISFSTDIEEEIISKLDAYKA